MVLIILGFFLSLLPNNGIGCFSDESSIKALMQSRYPVKISTVTQKFSQEKYDFILATGEAFMASRTTTNGTVRCFSTMKCYQEGKSPQTQNKRSAIDVESQEKAQSGVFSCINCCFKKRKPKETPLVDEVTIESAQVLCDNSEQTFQFCKGLFLVDLTIEENKS